MTLSGIERWNVEGGPWRNLEFPSKLSPYSCFSPTVSWGVFLMGYFSEIFGFFTVGLLYCRALRKEATKHSKGKKQARVSSGVEGSSITRACYTQLCNALQAANPLPAQRLPDSWLLTEQIQYFSLWTPSDTPWNTPLQTKTKKGNLAGLENGSLFRDLQNYLNW
jgi:hypothetical protein